MTKDASRTIPLLEITLDNRYLVRQPLHLLSYLPDVHCCKFEPTCALTVTFALGHYRSCNLHLSQNFRTNHTDVHHHDGVLKADKKTTPWYQHRCIKHLFFSRSWNRATICRLRATRPVCGLYATSFVSHLAASLYFVFTRSAATVQVFFISTPQAMGKGNHEMLLLQWRVALVMHLQQSPALPSCLQRAPFTTHPLPLRASTGRRQLRAQPSGHRLLAFPPETLSLSST
ncbi:hypothetical protein B0J12DRAFT_409163 [Macrophomina phaseolina]|uniref:Uncharacterized protein n=1 Tax=Macrophomina phaseolina TaxID=35725 RepID=A0ABQ8GLS6_9PEZI|nr:hypothetical protein B0J12DRAFT_409163 [Macrophomina phaseolina]